MKTLSHFIAIASLFALGCEKSDQQNQRPYPVEFAAIDDAGSPVGGVRFTLGDKEIYRTREGGRAVLQLRGKEGQELAIQATCPDGHTLDPVPSKLKLARVRALDGKGDKPLSFQARCVRSSKEVVLVVRAERGKGTKLTVPGQTSVDLDENGTVHIPLTFPRDQKTASLSFDTSTTPRLLPKNPERSFDLPSGDGIVLVNQDFSMAKITRNSPRATPKHIPYPIF